MTKILNCDWTELNIRMTRSLLTILKKYFEILFLIENIKLLLKWNKRVQCLEHER